MSKIKQYLFMLTLLAITGCDHSEQREARYLKQGNTLFARGDFDKARLDYKNAVRLRPADPEAYYRLGLVDEAEQNFRDAYNNFTLAEQQDAHYPPALLKIANYDLAGDQLDQAQKRVDTVLADSPDQPEAHALQAALLLRRKDYEGTEKEARRALTYDPANVTAYSVLTGLYFAQGNLQKAGATVDEGIAKNPDNLPLLLLKADIYRRAGDFTKVGETYRTIFALKPDNIQFHLDLATIYTDAGKTDQAEATLREAVAAKPDDWQIEYRLIKFLDQQRGLAIAEQEITAYRQANPDNDNPLFWLSTLYLAHGKADEATAFLKQIIAQNRLDDSGIQARAMLARIDLARDDKEEAETLANQVLEKNAGNTKALFVRASLAFDRQQYEEAVTDLRAIIRDQPQDVEALRLLAETFQRQGHPDLATDTLRQLSEAVPNSQQAFLDRAEKDLKQHETNQALNELKKGADANPVDIHADMMRADILSETGRYDEAIPLYDKILKQDPTENIAANNMASLIADYAYTDPVLLEKAGKLVERFANAKEPPVLDTVAWVLYRQGKIPTALTTMQKLSLASNAAYPMTLEMHYHYGAILVKADKIAEAKNQLQQAVRQGANYPGIDDAKQLLATLDKPTQPHP
jgi:tetratricopeptide (TPR) repeat protein